LFIPTASLRKWWSKGHGRLVDAPDGSWWMTLHAYSERDSRPWEGKLLLLPVVWTADGWFKVPDGISAADAIPKAHLEPGACAGDGVGLLPASPLICNGSFGRDTTPAVRGSSTALWKLAA